MSMTQRIAKFNGDYRFLSNFYLCEVQLGDIVFPSAEHAFQARKSLVPGVQRSMAQLATPGEVKRYGRTIELRPDWEQVKKRTMLLVVLTKFIQNPDLAGRLIGTEDALLVEGNHWDDNFWGSCTCPNCGNGDLNYGLNYLGRTLMFVRDVVRED